MAVIATPSEIQAILQIENKYSFISDMIPIVQSTTDKYFRRTFSTYPACFKRTTAILIKQMMDNPGALWLERVGDDEREFRGVDLSQIFSGLDDLKASKVSGAQFFNLNDVNTDLGL